VAAALVLGCADSASPFMPPPADWTDGTEAIGVEPETVLTLMTVEMIIVGVCVDVPVRVDAVILLISECACTGSS
jgi:hypothetical protein